MTTLVKKGIVTGVLVAMVGMAAGPAFAQVVFRQVSRVEAFDTDFWRVQAGHSFRVVVAGDGDTDLDLYVYDAVTGQLLGSDDDDTDYCVVRGYSSSGRLVIRITNRGSVWNRYILTVD